MTKENIQFSIITVCRNAAQTLEATLLSIFSQTYKNYEIIIIDGASDDGTVEIIKHYQNQITYWVSEPDSGIYNAMNKALAHINGDWVYFLNANDTFYSENVLSAIASVHNSHQEAQIIYGDVRMGEKIKSFAGIPGITYFFSHMICHQGIFYHTGIFREIGGYNEKYRIVADRQHLIRCLWQNHIIALHIPVVIANYDLSGVSGDHSLRNRERNQLRHEFFPKSIHRWLIIDFYAQRWFNSLYKKSPFKRFIDKKFAEFNAQNPINIIEGTGTKGKICH